jgi:hypothetical protein
MCNTNCLCETCSNVRIFIPEAPELEVDKYINVEGVTPIKVTRSKLADVTTYTIEAEYEAGNNGTNGEDGKDGKDGKDGVTPVIEIGKVESGTDAQVTNTGTPSHAVLNFVLPKGLKGDTGDDGPKGDTGDKGQDGNNGKDGITKGIKSYFIANGGTYEGYNPVGNFTQGAYVDLGDSTFKKLRIRAWVTLANMQNWSTLRLTRSDTPTYSGSLICQRIKHSEARLYVGQYEISGYIETTDRYIGFTFSDTPGGNYNSDGEQYGDFAIEVFVLD